VENIKTFNIRMPKSIWEFLKKQSIAQEKSMNEIIRNRLEIYKKNSDKRVDEQ
jgi:predicted HicB family RNase H-like nuclease